jgi:hypothetical protein
MAVLPVIPGAPISLTSILEIAKANAPLSNLTPGETLSVTVIEKIAANQYLMAVKDASISAKSDIPLKPGETLHVKVLSVQPQIILSVADMQKQNTDAKINERLLQWRLQPDAMTQLLNKVSEVAGEFKPGSLPVTIPPRELEGLLKLFSQIVFSGRTKANPLFVKDFVTQTGLMMEKDLAALVSQKTAGEPSILADNLKASLLKLSGAVDEILRNAAKLDPSVLTRLQNLSTFTSDALKTIESRQAVNVVYQQNENGLYLQIPLALGATFRQADVFIAPDNKDGQNPKRNSPFTVRIFLDLDYLGELAFEAAIREGRIRCIIQCESEEVRKLIEAASPQLREALAGIGYGVEQIDCLKTSGLADKRAEFIGHKVLGSTDLINSFA